jgi:hypothetical protein
VDGLTIDSSLSGQRLSDALTFIKFFTSQEAYYDALIPEQNDAPKYLLPPYKHFYTDKKVIANAPLYNVLFPLAMDIKPIKSENVGYNLRDVGAKLNQCLKK